MLQKSDRAQKLEDLMQNARWELVNAYFIQLKHYKMFRNNEIIKAWFRKKSSPWKNLPFVSVLVKVSSCCSVSITFFS